MTDGKNVGGRPAGPSAATVEKCKVAIRHIASGKAELEACELAGCSRSTLQRTCAVDSGLRVLLVRAREDSADSDVSRAMTILEDAMTPQVVQDDENGKIVRKLDNARVNAANNLAKALLWRAGCRAPARYGANVGEVTDRPPVVISGAPLSGEAWSAKAQEVAEADLGPAGGGAAPAVPGSADDE